MKINRSNDRQTMDTQAMQYYGDLDTWKTQFTWAAVPGQTVVSLTQRRLTSDRQNV